MLPIIHPAVAYLIYSGMRRTRDVGPPSTLATFVLVFSALIPDLIDQSLFIFLELPTTRTLGHSALIAIPACVTVSVNVYHRSIPNAVAVAFSVGYLSHLAADALWPLLLGKSHELGFLLWPITTSPPYVGQKSLFAIGEITVTTLWVELPILALGLVVWWHDGLPGIPVDPPGIRE